MTISQLSSYSTLSESFLEKNLRSIPHFKVGKPVIVRKSDFDRWLERYRVEPDEDRVKQLVYEIVAKVSNQK